MSDLLQQAKNAKQNGDIALAKQLLSQAIIQEPRNEAAWMLMSQVMEDVKLRRNCLERVLSINPNNAEASTALSKLNTSPLAPITRGERDKPITPDVFEKIPPFTPPYTWQEAQEQSLDLDDLTYPGVPDEPKEPPQETIPTFDWANDSAEPDKTIQKIFETVSNPEIASEPLPDTDLSWLEVEQSGSQKEATPETIKENEWVQEETRSVEESQPEPLPANLEDFKTSAEQQLGVDAFTSTEQVNGPVNTEYLLWDNPTAKTDRLVILSSRSLIIAHPKDTDIPHVMGLFVENKMMRDLLGKSARVVRLEEIQRMTTNLKSSKLIIDAQEKHGHLKHELNFSNPQVRDEFLTAIKFRLGANFVQSLKSFSMGDKIIPPIVTLLLIAFLGWLLVSGVSLLGGLPAFQSGTLGVILSNVQRFISSVGILTLLLLLTVGGLFTLIWLLNNLRKPSNLLVYKRS